MLRLFLEISLIMFCFIKTQTTYSIFIQTFLIACFYQFQFLYLLTPNKTPNQSLQAQI